MIYKIRMTRKKNIIILYQFLYLTYKISLWTSSISSSNPGDRAALHTDGGADGVLGHVTAEGCRYCLQEVLEYGVIHIRWKRVKRINVPYTVVYCTVLRCTTLYCSVLNYTALHWTVLYCTGVYRTIQCVAQCCRPYIMIFTREMKTISWRIRSRFKSKQNAKLINPIGIIQWLTSSSIFGIPRADASIFDDQW